MPQNSPSAPTIVSLTPLSLEADSRTLKSACSYARAGFRSIVVEGVGSRMTSFPEQLEVVSLSPPSPPPAAGGKSGRLGRILTAIRHGRGGALAQSILFAGFMGRFVMRYRLRPRHAIPPAALYHVHSYELFDVAWAMARRNGGRVIYDAHDYYQGINPQGNLPSFDRCWLLPAMRSIEARAVARADAIFTATNGTADLMTADFGRRPTVLRNCHDARMDRAPAQTIRERLGLTPSDRILVVSGNYKKGMAVPVLLDALALLPSSYHVAFVGRGYEAIAGMIAAHPAGNRVFTNLAQSPSELVPFLRSADIGLVIYEPYSENYRYALPNGFFQVVAAGLPVVYPALPEIVTATAGRPIGLCIDTLTAPAIAQAVETLMEESGPNRLAAGESLEDLSWQHEESVLLSTVHDLLGPVSPSLKACAAV